MARVLDLAFVATGSSPPSSRTVFAGADKQGAASGLGSWNLPKLLPLLSPASMRLQCGHSFQLTESHARAGSCSHAAATCACLPLPFSHPLQGCYVSATSRLSRAAVGLSCLGGQGEVAAAWKQLPDPLL